jgi:hypothetical protein
MSIDNDLNEVLNGKATVTHEPVEAVPLEVVQPNTVLPLHAQWERFKPQFAEAMAETPYAIDELERSIGQGRTLFFPGKNAAITAERAVYGNETFLQCTWCVGDSDEILALAPGVEAMGRLLGCTSMLVEGRRGWEKVLKPLGYSFWSVTLKKAL